MKFKLYRVCVVLALVLSLCACLPEEKPLEPGINAGTPILGKWITEACTRNEAVMSDGQIDTVWTKGIYEFNENGRVDMRFYAHQTSECNDKLNDKFIDEVVPPRTDRDRYFTFIDQGLMPERNIAIRKLDLFFPSREPGGDEWMVLGAYHVDEQQRLCFSDNLDFTFVFVGWKEYRDDRVVHSANRCLIR